MILHYFCLFFVTDLLKFLNLFFFVRANIFSFPSTYWILQAASEALRSYLIVMPRNCQNLKKLYKILLDLEIQTDLVIPTRRPDQVIVSKKKKKNK